MSRTYRRVFTPTKSRHANAIPYRRSDAIKIYKDDVEITIERDNRG